MTSSGSTKKRQYLTDGALDPFSTRLIDLFFLADPFFLVGVGFDLIKKMLPGSSSKEGFASILKQGL